MSSQPHPSSQGNDGTSNKKSNEADVEASKPIRLVLQRFRQATLLVNDNETVTVGKYESSYLQNPPSSGGGGILVYISFAKSATYDKVCQAAKTVMNLPILTKGSWGDGTGEVLKSLCDFAPSTSILLVPQANLTSKVKSNGKSIQYHGQVDKQKGQELYESFVDCIKAIALEHQCKSRKEPVPTWVTDCMDMKAQQQQQKKKTAIDASVEPFEMFRNDSEYSKWDELGIPLEDASGEPISKSQMKKLKKQYDGQAKKHAKFIASGGEKAGKIPTQNETKESKKDWSMLDNDFIHVVAGTFGNRQGLEISSDMGPFCHVINV